MQQLCQEIPEKPLFSTREEAIDYLGEMFAAALARKYRRQNQAETGEQATREADTK